MTPTQPQWATGYNNAAGLANFSIEPAVRRINPGIRRVSMAGTYTESGSKSADLIFGPEIDNATKKTILSNLGLTGSTIQAQNTFALPTNADRDSYTNYNALAIRPDDDEYALGSWRGFTIRLIFLQAI